ncbi:MAG: hypothetical protein HYW02_05345, partial [Deltaproteobacteria bacterium]|nr:hypothetical protein [Deltaproteobacteria bacterium]
MKVRLLLLPVLFLCLSLQIGCLGSRGDNKKPGFETIPPQKLQALGLPLSAFVVVSLDPATRHPLLLDSSTNSFKGEVKVPLGSQFDLTVIYTVDDPISGKVIEIAHYVRKEVLAETETTQVIYLGDENNWQTLFDLSPGIPNDLNLDGDAYNNFIEVAYGSHPENSESLPEGAKTSATHKDPIFGSQDVALPPPGADITAALNGDEEVLLETTTPFDLKEFKLLSPGYGIEILSSAEE